MLLSYLQKADLIVRNAYYRMSAVLADARYAVVPANGKESKYYVPWRKEK